MKVALGTIEVDDGVRRAINAYYGYTGLATRDTIRSFMVNAATADLEEVCFNYEQQQQAIEKVTTG